MFNKQSGQSLLELVVVIAVAALVVGALVFATISSLRNAATAKSQAQATKLAQDGLEKMRTLRNRDGLVNFNYASGSADKFSQLWTIQMSNSCSPCHFILTKDANNNDYLVQVDASTYAPLSAGLASQIRIQDSSSYDMEKTITSVVKWTDFAGEHSSIITTILTKY